MGIEKLTPLRQQSRGDAVRRREARLSEEITGWAVNALFPIPEIPNVYTRFPGRRIRKTRGLIRGAIFVVNHLAIWSFELTWELIWPRDAAESQEDCSSVRFEIDPGHVERS
jgi:hypothetical protein